MFVRSSLTASSVFLAVLLTGCSTSFNPVLSGPLPVSSATISGNVQGGRQPIVGSHVYLLEANTTAYAGSGIAASTSNASKSLLTSGDGTDSIGTYVLTNSTGGFSVSNKYNCDTGAQVYLLSLGGMPDGVNNNSSAGLMAVLGTCGTDFSASTTVNMNELSTIAAAYAFAGFATDATHVGAPSATDTMSATGIKNAFANANQLYDISSNPYTGGSVARTTTPAGNGTVPQQQLHTLANILSACVNTSGPSSSQCSTLFSGLMSAGASGTPATDTATEAIYMAQNPSITSIYSVTGTGPNPYSPWFSTAAPNDLTVAISFSVNTGNSSPYTMATDANGYAWVGAGGLLTVSPLGAVVSGSSPYTGSGNLTYVVALALDTDGNVWTGDEVPYNVAKVTVTNDAIQSLTVFESGAINPLGVAVDGANDAWFSNAIGGSLNSNLIGLDSNGNALLGSPFNSTGGLHEAGAIAVDSSNNLWIRSYNSPAVSRFTNTGSFVTQYTTNITNGYAIAIGQSDQAWTANYSNNTLVGVSNAGVSTSAYGGGGMSRPSVIAVDGNNRLWMSGSGGRIACLDSNGVAYSTSSGLIGPSSSPTSGPFNYAVGEEADISGDLWIATNQTNVVEFIGVATPTYQPLSLAAKNNKLGQRP